MDLTTARSQKKARVFYGWWIVAACFLALTIEAGVTYYGSGIFLKALIDDFGWSRGETSGAMSVFWLVQVLAGPIVGRLVDRYGARLMMSAGAALFGVAFYLLSGVDTPSQLLAGYLLVGIGNMAMATVPATAALANWFVRRRGMVLAATYTGLGFGGVVAPPVLTYLVSRWGWRGAYLAIAAVTILVILPLLALVVRTRPEEKGLLPDDGVGSAGSGRLDGGSQGGRSDRPSSTVKPFATSAFWLITAGYFLAILGSGAVGVHQYAFLTDIGWSLGTAAVAMSLMGFLSMAGKLLFGAIGDRISPCYVAAICFAGYGAGLALVLPAKLDPIVWLYLVTIGLNAGGIAIMRPLVIAEVFGVEGFGLAFGLITGLGSLGAVVGPPFAGYIFDVTGGYDLAFLVCVIAFGVAAGALWFAKRRSPSVKHA